MTKILTCEYTNLKKDGTPILSKFGKPSWRTTITIPDKQGNITGFLPFAPDRWVGTDQEIELYEEEYNGQKQLKFKLPAKGGSTGSPEVAKKLEEILNSMTTIKLNVAEIKLAIVELLADKRTRMGESMGGETSTTTPDYPEMPSGPDDIGF